MSLTLQNENEVPPGGWRYMQPETALWIKAPSWGELVKEVKKHRNANNLPIGLNFEQEIVDQLCASLPASWCSQSDPTLGRTSHVPVTLDQVVNTGKMLVEFFLKFGRKKVPIAQATERAAVCVRCPFNQKLTDCNNCSMKTVRELMVSIVGGEATEHDNRLDSCTICGCELRAKVRLPTELLMSYLTPEKKLEFPLWCWLRTEIA